MSYMIRSPQSPRAYRFPFNFPPIDTANETSLYSVLLPLLPGMDMLLSRFNRSVLFRNDYKARERPSPEPPRSYPVQRAR